MAGRALTVVLLSDDLQQLVCRPLPDAQHRRWSSSLRFHLQQLQVVLSSDGHQPGRAGRSLRRLLPTKTANAATFPRHQAESLKEPNITNV